MADSQPQKRVYQIDLYQSHWTRTKTETFTVEASDIKEAEAAAEAIAQDKSLDENYDFEYTDLTSIADSQPAPEDTATKAQ